jgi:hypothetical protein
MVMILGWSHIEVVCMVQVGCVRRSQSKNGILNMQIFFLSESTMPRALFMWHIASSVGPVPKLFILYLCGQN